MERSGPLSSVSCKSSQIVAAVSGGSNDGSVLVPVCEAVYFAMYSDVPPRRAAPRRATPEEYVAADGGKVGR